MPQRRISEHRDRTRYTNFSLANIDQSTIQMVKDELFAGDPRDFPFTHHAAPLPRPIQLEQFTFYERAPDSSIDINSSNRTKTSQTISYRIF